MKDLRIADKKRYDGGNGEDYHFRRYINALDNEAGIPNKTVWELDNDMETIDLTMEYDGQLDVMSYIEAHELTPLKPNSTKHKIADLEELGMNFSIELVKNYKVGSNQTDQAEYVTLSNDGILSVKPVYGTSAIDRTPIIRVKLMHGNNVVKVAYIKIKIVRKGGTNPSMTLEAGNYTFECGKDGVKDITYQQMSQYVYAKMFMSKTEFHDFYSIFEDINDPTDVGTVIERTNSEDQTQEGTHVPVWTISEADLWKYAGQEVTNKIRYYSAEHKSWVEIVLHATIGEVTKSFNVTSASYISNYWENGAAQFNVQVPQSTSDRNPNNCVFVNDINSPFVTNDLGILKLSNYVTMLEYRFCNDMKGNKTIGGKTYNFTLSNDQLKLYVGTELIAEIHNNDGGPKPNYIVYNKNSNIAKEMLNSGKAEMYVLIQAVGYACNDRSKALTITFNGEDHFKAVYKRPVNITAKAADNFIDGVDVGEKGSFIRLEDLIAPYDWRGRQFSQYDNYWDFYGPFSVVFDRDDAECNLDGVRQAVPATIELTQINATSYGGKTSKYGFITYKNNGTTVKEPFEIYVKVTVTYGWGDIKTDWITVPVAKTIETNAPRK